MRSKEHGLTPREAALVITMGWIKAVHQELTEDITRSDERPSFQAQVKSALAKEYNRLSARVGSMDQGSIEV